MADFNKIINGATGAASLLTSAIQSGVKMGTLPDTNEEQGAIDDLYSRQTSSSSMTDLQNLFDSTRLAKTNYGWRDLIGMSDGQAAGNIIGDTLSQGLQGVQAGGAFSPLGAGIGGAIGAVAGALSSSFGYLARKNKAIAEADRLNKEGVRANNVFMDNFSNSVENAMVNKRNQSLLNLAALGGPLDTTFTNGVRFITEGGSHESNPLSGVPQGIAADGIPNLVEEGEVIYNDYVYSRRLKVPKEDKESLGLKKDKEYTYADAAKQIQKESEERPNDPISKRNLAEMMSRLQGSQEALKEKRDGQALKRAVNNMTPDELAMFMQQLQQPQQMQPMMAMQGMQPMKPTKSEVPMFAKGGLLGHKHAVDKIDQTGFLYTWGDLQPTDLGISFDENGQPIYDIIGDWGYTRPTDIGDGKGIITRADENGRTQYAILNRDPRDYESSLKYRPLYDKDGKEIGGNYEIVPRELPENNKDLSIPSNPWAQALRAAPVFGSLASSIASLFDNPNYSNIARAERAMASVPRVSATPIGQRMAYTPIDINYIATQQANNALGARRALNEYGAGNPAGTQQAQITNNYTSQTALANAIMQANQLNRQNLAQALEFNRQTDSANASSNLQAALANQQKDTTAADFLFRTGQLRDAELGRVQANRSANLTGLYNNLGNLGQDILNRDMATAMAQSYGVTYNPYMDALMRTYGYRGAKGGKLNTKKGGKNA